MKWLNAAFCLLLRVLHVLVLRSRVWTRWRLLPLSIVLFSLPQPRHEYFNVPMYWLAAICCCCRCCPPCMLRFSVPGTFSFWPLSTWRYVRGCIVGLTFNSTQNMTAGLKCCPGKLTTAKIQWWIFFIIIIIFKLLLWNKKTSLLNWANIFM